MVTFLVLHTGDIRFFPFPFAEELGLPARLAGDTARFFAEPARGGRGDEGRGDGARGSAAPAMECTD